MFASIHWKDVFLFGGAIMGSIAGAGFASGQEVMQFFTHLGFPENAGAGLVAMLLLSWLTMTILEDGRRYQFQSGSAIFSYYCGKKIGLFFEWFVPTFMLMAVSVMFSAASAVVSEYYQADPVMGRFILAALTLATVWLGLKKLIQIVGSVTPFFIAFTILIGIVSIARHPGALEASNQTLQTIQVPGAFSHWFFSGLMYASFLLLGLTPFTAGVGRHAKTRADTILAGLFAGFLFLAGAMLLSNGLLVQITEVYDKEIPSLVMATRSLPLAAPLFALFMLSGVYSASVSLLWIAVNRLYTDEKSRQYRITAAIMVVISFFGGHLPFSTMVGYVYPTVGYMGLILIACIFLTKFRERQSVSHAPATDNATGTPDKTITG